MKSFDDFEPRNMFVEDSSRSIRKSASPNRDQIVAGNFRPIKDLGEGTFGNVRLMLHLKTGKEVAVKILEKSRIVDSADVERVVREIKILNGISHPHIIKLEEIIETRNRVYLIMEYASGGELFDYIVSKDRLPEKEACAFFL